MGTKDPRAGELRNNMDIIYEKISINRNFKSGNDAIHLNKHFNQLIVFCCIFTVM